MSLRSKYKKGERYVFVATDERDVYGNQIMKDESGKRHLLTGIATRYENGVKVRCSVLGFGKKPVAPITSDYLVLSGARKVSETTRIPSTISPVSTVPPAIKGFSDIQGLGRHKSGKPFICNCCGKSYPAGAGWRVDLKDIYFCNACARKIYEPKGRESHKFIIYTPMGNKR